MITLYPIPQLSARMSYTHRPPAPDHLEFTPSQIKHEAQRVTRGGLSAQAWNTLDLLATGNVLPANRLRAAERTLRKWAGWNLISRLQIEPRDLQAAYAALGLSGMAATLYALDVVGRQISATRHGMVSPFLASFVPTEALLRELVLNEVVFRMADLLGERGWRVEWLGGHECELKHPESGEVLLSPGGLLRCIRGEEDRAFALDYHPEAGMFDAVKRVKAYEAAARSKVWFDQWEVETFPPVLAVFRHLRVGRAYKQAMKLQDNCTFYGKPLDLALAGKLHDWNLLADASRHETLIPRE